MKEVNIKGNYYIGIEENGFYYPTRELWLLVDTEHLQIGEIILLKSFDYENEVKVTDIKNNNLIKAENIK